VLSANDVNALVPAARLPRVAIEAPATRRLARQPDLMHLHHQRKPTT
jgi:hypothetical protein